ncbi:CYTH and CHAD domain-containing protein [Amycolatopsis magusensis]|uniref:CHAD domain-containing protein n=1 Tax=Amycolatopsis magusensis TaxID=882444 RepID=A0ABS4Q1V5_9PSEU|nr:CYTH and CHAD domain-containing protein [Amycolatopsis magusensis]MBP2185063.1 CHAD domain-containing protein [Amycolatopsis magusensis]
MTATTNPPATPQPSQTPQTALERERKFDFPLDLPIPDLRARGPIAGQSDPLEERLDATYYDTARYDLARAGVTLRRRTGGGDEGWHLKLPVGKDAREEITLPLDDSEAPTAEVPRELAELVRGHTRGEDLIAIAGLRTVRYSVELADADGRVLATLTDDHVTGEAAGTVARLDQWRELEVELSADAEDGTLDTVADLVVEAGAVPSEWPSKLRRLIGDLLPADTRKAPGKKATAGEVVLHYLRAQVDALHRHDAGVRRDTEDSVHQMRVAMRRLRSALGAFRRVLDRDAVQPLRDELKWLGGELGPVRDNEVLHAGLAGQAARLPRRLTIGPVAVYLDTYFEQRARRAQAHALTALNSTRYLNLLRALDSLLDDPPLTKKAKRPARTELRQAVLRADRRLRRAAAALEGAEDRGAALHEVRKKAKQARYTADALRPVAGKKLNAWRKRVKAVQSTLGDHHDTVVARAELVPLAVAADRDGHSSFSYGVLHGRNELEAERLDARFRREWPRIAGGTTPGWLR